jgi:copper oxidase (laccase) domain-containing protein
VQEVAPRTSVHAWLGPAIGPAAFEVGAEVVAAFIDQDPEAEIGFVENARGRWQCDLYTLARRALARAGVASISGGSACTHTDAGHFFSHRRAAPTGRMATFAWLAPGAAQTP